MKKILFAGALSLLAAAATGVYAQSGGPVKLAYLGEISGQLAVSGGQHR